MELGNTRKNTSSYIRIDLHKSKFMKYFNTDISSRTRKWNKVAENSQIKLNRSIIPKKIEEDIDIDLKERLKCEQRNLSQVAYELSLTFNYHKGKLNYILGCLWLKIDENSNLSKILQYSGNFCQENKRENLRKSAPNPPVFNEIIEIEDEDKTVMSHEQKLQKKIDEYLNISIVFL